MSRNARGAPKGRTRHVEHDERGGDAGGEPYADTEGIDEPAPRTDSPEFDDADLGGRKRLSVEREESSVGGKVGNGADRARRRGPGSRERLH